MAPRRRAPLATLPISLCGPVFRRRLTRSLIRSRPSRRISGGAPTADMIHKNLFPFYKQPLDVRITVNGAVAENYTASAGDQAAWLGRWGYVPTQYGGTNLPVPDDHLMAHDATLNNNNWNVD